MLRTRPGMADRRCSVIHRATANTAAAVRLNEHAFYPALVDHARAGQARRYVQYQHQAEQDHAHDQGRAAGRCRTAECPGEQRQKDWREVHHQQRQAYRNARHRRVDAEALHRDQQAQHQLPAPGLAAQTQRVALPQHQGYEHQESHPGAAENRQQQTSLMIEGDACGDMVAGEGAGQGGEDQRGDMPGERGGRHGEAKHPYKARSRQKAARVGHSGPCKQGGESEHHARQP